MTQDLSTIRERAYKDVFRSSKVVLKKWNQPCGDYADLERIRNDFCRLTNPVTWVSISVKDINRLKEICRCCLRFVPDWPQLMAQSVDACFSFPDATVRGLLWRCVLFLIRMEEPLRHGVTSSIKDKIAQRLGAEGEFKAVIVDGFLDTLNSECVAADVGLNPVVVKNALSDQGSEKHS
jgi:hypothetical protein